MLKCLQTLQQDIRYLREGKQYDNYNINYQCTHKSKDTHAHLSK